MAARQHNKHFESVVRADTSTWISRSAGAVIAITEVSTQSHPLSRSNAPLRLLPKMITFRSSRGPVRDAAPAPRTSSCGKKLLSLQSPVHVREYSRLITLDVLARGTCQGANQSNFKYYWRYKLYEVPDPRRSDPGEWYGLAQASDPYEGAVK